MIEILKTKNNMNLTFMKDIFTERDIQYNLRSENHLQLPKMKTTSYGIKNIFSTEVTICGPHYQGELKIPTPCRVQTKNKIMIWHGNTCICRLCKIFIKDLGFCRFSMDTEK